MQKLAWGKQAYNMYNICLILLPSFFLILAAFSNHPFFCLLLPPPRSLLARILILLDRAAMIALQGDFQSPPCGQREPVHTRDGHGGGLCRVETDESKALGSIRFLVHVHLAR